MRTNGKIHPEWLSVTITRFHHYTLIGWNMTIYPNGSWEGLKK